MNKWDDNDYVNVLEAAGDEIIAFEKFGSYSGMWAAIVKHNDKVAAVISDYGSCSGCDSYEMWAHYNPKTQAELMEFYKTMEYKYLSLDDALIQSKWEIPIEINNWLKENWPKEAT